MPSSIREQILARIAAALAAPSATPVGDAVFRSRVVPLKRQLALAIVVKPASHESRAASDMADHNAFDADIEVIARGDPWDQLADPVEIAAHKVVMNDATLADLVDEIRLVGTGFEHDAADNTAGVSIRRYRFIFLSDARDITRAPPRF